MIPSVPYGVTCGPWTQQLWHDANRRWEDIIATHVRGRRGHRLSAFRTSRPRRIATGDLRGLESHGRAVVSLFLGDGRVTRAIPGRVDELRVDTTRGDHPERRAEQGVDGSSASPGRWTGAHHGPLESAKFECAGQAPSPARDGPAPAHRWKREAPRHGRGWRRRVNRLSTLIVEPDGRSGGPDRRRCRRRAVPPSGSSMPAPG